MNTIEQPKMSYREISIAQDTNGELYFPVRELFESIFSYGAAETRRAIFESIIASEEFGKHIANVLHGWSHYEWDSWSGRDYAGTFHSADPLLEALMPFADDAAKTLLRRTIGYARGLRKALADKDAHIKHLSEKWPETHKQYMPKDSIYCHNEHVEDEEVVALLDAVKKEGIA